MNLSPAELQFRSSTRNLVVLATVLLMASLVFAGAIQYQAAKESDLREAIESYHLRTLPLLDRIANRLASLELQTGEDRPRGEDHSSRPKESPRGLLVKGSVV